MTVELTPVRDLPHFQPGDDLADIVGSACRAQGIDFQPGDVLAITGKIVSKVEGRIIELSSVTPSPRALRLAELTDKDPRLVELVLSESVEVIRARPGNLLVRHRLGWVSAVAGVDQSNIDGDDIALLLPEDPDGSAQRLRGAFEERWGVQVGIVITDSHGRPFRIGNTGVAIGAAGITTVRTLEGQPDLFGRPLSAASIVPLADLIASAAMLVSGEADEGTPVVRLRGLDPAISGTDSAAELVRDPTRDLFAAPDRDYL